MIKKLAIFLAIPASVALLFIAFLPSLISTQAGQQFALSYLLLQFPPTTTAQKLQVSWLGPQKVEQISVIDPEKGINLSCNAIEVNQSIFSLALNGLSPSTVTVDHLDGRFNNLKALGVSSDLIKILGDEISVNLQSTPEQTFNRLIAHLQSPKATANFDGRIDLRDETIQFTRDPIFTYQFNDPQSKEPLTLQLSIHAPSVPIQPRNWQNASFTGDIALKTLPAQSTILAADFEIELNHTISNKGENQLVNLNLHNSDAYLKLNGNLSKGILTLRAPLMTEINLNSWLKQPELAKRSPLNLIHSASAPIKLTIAPEGFQAPLNADLKNLQVESMQLDLGMLVFKREGPLSQIAKQFDSKTNEPFSVWFTPAFLSAQNGIATLYRLDLLLLHTYPIAAWGNIDLVQDQLGMTIGIPADALSKFYKLPLLQTKELITLPIVGSLRNPKIDSSKFELKLSSLAAKKLGGVAGQIIGSAVNLNVNSETIPKPTSAVPWANLLTSPENKKEIDRGEPSLKDLQLKNVQKKADSLLKKFLPF